MSKHEGYQMIFDFLKKNPILGICLAAKIPISQLSYRVIVEEFRESDAISGSVDCTGIKWMLWLYSNKVPTDQLDMDTLINDLHKEFDGHYLCCEIRMFFCSLLLSRFADKLDYQTLRFIEKE